MFLTTLFQVIARAVLGISSVWSEELARFLFVWQVFLGAALLVRDDGLIRITLLTDRSSATVARILRVLTGVATVPFVVVLTWGAYLNMLRNWNTFAPTLDWLRIGYVYLMLFLSGLLMFWYLLVVLVEQARGSTPTAAADSGGRG